MRSLLIPLLLAGLAAPTSAAAEEAAELFKSLYADRIAQVEQTPAAEDDVELAGQMLEARETLGEQPTLGFLLCQHAGQLAARSPAGLETAVQAIKGMAALDHPGRLAAARKITNAVQATYTRSRGAEARKAAGASLVDAMSHVAALAEQEGKLAVGITTLQRASSVASAVVPHRSAAVKAELDRLQQFQRAEREAAILRDRLEKDPKDTEAAEQLARFYLVRMKNPKQALGFAKSSGNAELVKNLVAATLPPESLSDKASLDLGVFCVELAAESAPPHQGDLYRRAATALNHFLTVHDNSASLAATKARLYLDTINNRLKTLDKAVATRPTSGSPTSGGGKPEKPGPKVRFYRMGVPGSYDNYVYQVALFPNGKAAIHGAKYTGGRDTYIGSCGMIGPKLALNAGVNGKYYFVRRGDKLVGASNSGVTFTELSEPPSVFQKFVKK